MKSFPEDVMVLNQVLNSVIYRMFQARSKSTWLIMVGTLSHVDRRLLVLL